MTRAPDAGNPPQKPEKPDARAARLAAALRANLQRRKAQERARTRKPAAGKDKQG